MAPKVCIVTGGSGFIGRFLLRDILEKHLFDAVYNLDIRAPQRPLPGEIHVIRDVCKPIDLDVGPFDPEASWIFNLAAACREPGFEPHEYFDINVGGAETVTAFAATKGFRNVFFTSTMSSYGRMLHPTPETAPQYPETPYGVSKAIAERIHRAWLAADPARRLVICRPSVIFGPGDKENIPRMLSAVRKGYFVFPGSPDIVKGYGYVHGLVESMHFVIARKERPLAVYNYAERDCLPLRGMVEVMGRFFGKRVRAVRVPIPLLVLAAYGFVVLGKLRGRKYAIHPVRVRKVAFPTNLKPQYLIDAGFPFKYPLEQALEHWKAEAPADLA
jgi:nucleoside-diphosphate-sugar epimerase